MSSREKKKKNKLAIETTLTSAEVIATESDLVFYNIFNNSKKSQSGRDDSECYDSAKLKLMFRTLFDKCISKYSDNNNSMILKNCCSSHSSNCSDETVSCTEFTSCANLLDYFHQDINSNNIMSNNSKQNIELLKRLFTEHFKPCSNTDTVNFTVDNCRLDFELFSQILAKWIKLLNENDINSGDDLKSSGVSDDNDDSSFSVHSIEISKEPPLSKFNLSCTKSNKSYLYNKKRGAGGSSLSNETPDSTASSPSSISSSSIPSMSSVSDEDSAGAIKIVYGSQSKRKKRTAESKKYSYIDIDITSNPAHSDEEEKHLTIDTGHEIKIQTEPSTSVKNSESGNDSLYLKVNELNSENVKLKLDQQDLKIQLQNAEDLNGQLVADLEGQTSKLAGLNRIRAELQTKINMLNEENEQMKRLIEQLRYNSEALNSENSALNLSLKKSLSKLELTENEVALLNAQTYADKSEIEKLGVDLSKLKTLNREIKSLNVKLDQQLIDLKLNLVDKDRLIEKLNESIKDYKCENESLAENLTRLRSDLQVINERFLETRIYQINASANNIANDIIDSFSNKNEANYENAQVKTVDKESSNNKKKNNKETLITATKTTLNFSKNNEAENLISSNIAKNLNENSSTFHTSNNIHYFYNNNNNLQQKNEQNQNFLCEQLEHQLTRNYQISESASIELENLIGYFQSYFSLLEQIKLQFDNLSSQNTLSTNSEPECIVRSLRTLLNNLFRCSFNKNNNFEEKTQTLVSRVKSVLAENSSLRSRQSSVLDQATQTLCEIKTEPANVEEIITEVIDRCSSSDDSTKKCEHESEAKLDEFSTSSDSKSDKRTNRTQSLLDTNSASAEILNCKKLSTSTTTTAASIDSKLCSQIEASNSTNSKISENSSNRRLQQSYKEALVKSLSKHRGKMDCSNHDYYVDENSDKNENTYFLESNISPKISACYTIKNSFEPFNKSNHEESKVENNSFGVSRGINIIQTKSSSKRFQQQINIVSREKANEQSFDFRLLNQQPQQKQQCLFSSNSLCLSSSCSLPSLFLVDQEEKPQTKSNHIFKQSIRKTATLAVNKCEVGTQTTGESKQELDLVSLKDKKRLFKLTQQLTRDSGIDSDNNPQKQQIENENQQKQPKMEKNSSSSSYSSKGDEDKSKSATAEILTRPSSLPFSTSFKADWYGQSSSQPNDSLEYVNNSISSYEIADHLTNNNESNEYEHADAAELMINLVKRSYEAKAEIGNSVASNKRLLYKNSYKKHHTIASGSVLSGVESSAAAAHEVNESPNSQSLDRTQTKSQHLLDIADVMANDIIFEKYSKYKELIESSIPIISHTALSKFAIDLKRNAAALSAADHDFLDPNPTAFKMTTNSYTATSRRLSENDQALRQQAHEHRLRLLQSNFDQISVSYHTDKDLVTKCIETYQERFQRLDDSSSGLFDEAKQILNKLVDLLNELPPPSTCSGCYTEDNDSNNNKNASEQRSKCRILINSASIDSNCSCMSDLRNEMTGADSSLHRLSQRSRKFMQESLSRLNGLNKQLQKNMLNAVATTSLLSALKQEMHLSDLIKVSVSYVKELRKSLSNSTRHKISSNFSELDQAVSSKQHLKQHQQLLLKRSVTIGANNKQNSSSSDDYSYKGALQGDTKAENLSENKRMGNIKNRKSMNGSQMTSSEKRKNWLLSPSFLADSAQNQEKPIQDKMVKFNCNHSDEYSMTRLTHTISPMSLSGDDGGSFSFSEDLTNSLVELSEVSYSSSSECLNQSSSLPSGEKLTKSKRSKKQSSVRTASLSLSSSSFSSSSSLFSSQKVKSRTDEICAIFESNFRRRLSQSMSLFLEVSQVYSRRTKTYINRIRDKIREDQSFRNKISKTSSIMVIALAIVYLLCAFFFYRLERVF